MMIDFSMYDDLEDLYEIRSELDRVIEERENKLRDIQFEQEEMQLEESLEEWKDI